jgi:hypothetical protein
VILLWAGWFLHSLWFIFISSYGWVRHNWHALILAVLLLSFLTAYLWQQVSKPLRVARLIAPVLLTGVLLIGFVDQANTASLIVSDKLVERWYNEHLVSPNVRIPWSLVPNQAQQDAVDFIARLPAQARVFYPEGHKSAEMAVLTGRILYPLERRRSMPAVEGDIILVGPSLISPWRRPGERPVTRAEQQAFIEEVMGQVRRECPHLVFENDYYIICTVD